MHAAMLGLLAETPIHPGAGRGIGVVDLPVAREAATDYPVLVGSSLKGALLDKMRTTSADDATVRFGTKEHAGDLLVFRCAPFAAAGAQSDRFLPVDHLPAPHRTVPARPRPCRRAQLERLETDLQRMQWDEFGGELQVALGWAATPADARAPLERRAAMRWRIMRICSRSR